MKIVTFYTENYRPMLERFENSFQDEFEHLAEKINLDEGEVKGAGGGIKIWEFKTWNVINKIKENMGEEIIISDIDIQFFQPVIPAVQQALASCDMAFQKEYESSGVNIGFFGLRCNETTLAFWEEIQDMVVHKKVWDQKAVNLLLYQYDYPVRWDRLPAQFWNWTQGGLGNPRKPYLFDRSDLLKIRHDMSPSFLNNRELWVQDCYCPKRKFHLSKNPRAIRLCSVDQFLPWLKAKRSKRNLEVLLNKDLYLAHINCEGGAKDSMENKFLILDTLENWQNQK